MPITSPSKSALETAYVKRGQTLREIAYAHGTSPSTVSRWLVAAGIPARRRGPRSSKA